MSRFRIIARLAVLLAPTIFCFARDVEFNRDVRPILSDKCYLCHGADAKAKNIPLRMDSEQAAKAAMPKGEHAIVEGHPEESELIRRITAKSAGLRMPPVYSGLKLSDTEIETLRDWIAQGAKWEKHWSFIPPKRPALPPVKTAAWVRNPIDSFILARLEREGLAPSPEADRETLLRRVTLDLTGLPPTPAEIDAFVNDDSPAAYEKIVDRLLASPRYGERMAYRWLDAARYADTNGYQYDGPRDMWRWRDWVISAFNRNQPFNQFALDQIAGDLLPNATLDQKIATGFNRNHRINTEDGIVPEEYAVEYVVDRVDTTSTVFLGLTLGCARCHNHKYDPFTQKEFYQLYAYFNNVPERGRGMKYGNSTPVVPAPTREQQAALADLDQRIRQIETFLRDREQAIARAQSIWTAQALNLRTYWAPSRGLIASHTFDDGNDAKLPPGISLVDGHLGRAASFDGKTFVTGANTTLDIDDPFTISTWFFSDSTPDGSLVTEMQDNPKGKGFGVHLDHGKVQINLTSNWVDDAIRVETADTLASGQWHHVAVTYTGSKMADDVHVYVDGRPARLNVLLDTLYRPYRNAGKAFKEPLRIGAGWGPQHRFKGLIDDTHLYSRVLSEPELTALAAASTIASIARTPESARSASQKQQIRWYFLEDGAPPEFREARQKQLALLDEKDKLVRAFPSVMVMAELSPRRETHLLVRGVYDKPGDTVQPGVPAILPPMPARVPNNRLGFAKWLIDPGNPLLARVTVNRFWQMYFGTGIVKTVEDFGSQGEWPVNPELLDWLATEFVRTGWDVKQMQRLIVTSAAYRESSKATPELLQRDPENRLVARGGRFRLPAEMIRDQALAVSGLLVERVGGPSVKPSQPPGLWKEIAMQDADYDQGHGADLYRRSLYTFWKRTIVPPMPATFDAALRESCVVHETRTNTPLQALNLMNGVQFLEAARFLGQRIMKEGGSEASSRLRYGFRLATGRWPSSAELDVLRGNLQFHLDYFGTDPEKVKEYLSQGESQNDPSLSPRDLAAYASVASLILNLDEVITKQ